MTVVWSERALRDFDELAAYISEESEKSAALVEERIRREAALIAEFPFIGRMGRIPGTRERVVVRTPFVMIYRVEPERIAILRLYRSTRKPPGTLSF